jgi:hypothetical protein
MRSSKIPAHVNARVRMTAGHRCGYCLTAQRYVMQVLSE